MWLIPPSAGTLPVVGSSGIVRIRITAGMLSAGRSALRKHQALSLRFQLQGIKMNNFSLLACVLAVATSAVSAKTVTVTGGPELLSLGDTIGSQYDEFKFDDGSFVAQLGAMNITGYDFIAGVNATIPGTATGSASFDVSFAGLHDTIVLPFTLDVNTLDTISFASTTHDYFFGGHEFAFTTDAFSVTTGGSVHGELTGSISAVAAVPEPSTYALMLAGVAAIGFVTRRKAKGQA
jgi:PEP-CTERM motif